MNVQNTWYMKMLLYSSYKLMHPPLYKSFNYLFVPGLKVKKNISGVQRV